MILVNLCAGTKGMVPWESVAGEEIMTRMGEVVKHLLDAVKQLEL